MNPLVSILMPAYNAADYIRTAVASCLSQTYPDWELVIVDDGSTDCTIRMVEVAANGDERVRLVKRPHCGAVSTLNVAWAESSGSFIARLDADDSQDRTRIEKQVRYLQKHPQKPDMVTCLSARLELNNTVYYDVPKIWNATGAWTMAKRCLCEQLVEWADLPTCTDLEWALRAMLSGATLGVVCEQLYHYRISPTSDSVNKARSDMWQRNILESFGLSGADLCILNDGSGQVVSDAGARSAERSKARRKRRRRIKAEKSAYAMASSRWPPLPFSIPVG